MPGLGIGLSLGLGGGSGGGAGLSAAKSTYSSTIAAGALIAALIDPFGSGAAFSVVGNAPSTLALASGGRIVAGNGAQVAGQSSTIVVRASKGQRAIEEPLTFMAVQDGTSPLPPPLRAVATNFQTPTGFVTAAGTKTEWVYRYTFFLGGDASEIRLAWANWATTGFGAFTDTSGRTIYKVSIELDGTSTVVPVTFSGQRGTALASGANEFYSDTLTPDMFGLTVFPANRRFWVRGIESVAAAGNTIATGVNNPSISGARATVYDPANRIEQVDATGPMSTPTGGTTSASQAVGPSGVLGRFTGNSKSVAFFGDSLMDGSNDFANFVGGNGYGPRAAVPSSLTNIVAHMKLAKVGARAADLSQNTKLLAWLKYFNILYLEPGTNDLAAVSGGGATAAAVTSSLQSIMGSARSAGINRIIGSKLKPRLAAANGGTTDAYATEAGQTVDANFGSGSRAEALNAQWEAWLADGTIQALDRCDKARGTDPWKWPVNGNANYPSSDGVHYSTALAILMMTETRAAIDAITL